MEGNNEGDNESLLENKATACNQEGLHIFYTYLLYLIGLQGLSRMLSSFFKWRMLRFLTIEQIGLQDVMFHTLTTLIFYISREGIRCGCLRQNSYDIGRDIDSKWVRSNSRILGVAWLTLPWGVFVTMVILMFWQGHHVLFDYNSPIFILGVAIILELCCEPLYILAQHLLLLRLRVIFESTATISRCVVTYILLLRGIGLDGGLAFAYAQLAYSCCLLLCYWSYFLCTYQGTIFPFSMVYNKGNVFSFGFKRNLQLDVSFMKLCFVFTLKLGLKSIQEEGVKWMLMSYETTYNQGIYGLVDNIGSLVVRSILQPFEETAFRMFAKESLTRITAIDKKSNNNCNIERMFLLALKPAIFIGLVFVAFGPNFAYVLLRFYSKYWTDENATIALGYYWIYILTLAINGVSEAFVRAVITQPELSIWKFISKLIFFAIASIYLSKALPNWRVLGVLVTSALVTYLSKLFVLDFENFFSTAILHIGVGMACLGGLFVALFKYERAFLQEIVAFQNKKRD